MSEQSSELAINRREAPEESADRPYRQAARGRLVALPFALGLITLGLLFLAAPQIDGFEVNLSVIALIMTAAFVLTNMFRFFASGRRERGLIFLALVILFLGAVFALMIVGGDELTAERWWPLTLVGVAMALFMTFIVERQHEAGLIGLGFMVLAAAGISFLVTLDIIPESLIDSISDYWPLIIAFMGITLVPLALRRS